MAKQKRKTPARKAPAKKSTALAVRPRVEMKIEDPNGMLDGRLAKIGELGELSHTGGIGLGEVKLSPEELTVISRPVNRDDVMLLPDGTAYLPHLFYTRWLNEAFGPTGWAIVPAAKPAKNENLIIVPYILYIHRVAVAYANGAAEYYEKNKRQTYDDVIESTVAFGLRRLCKRMGMALELWDKRWLHAFMLAEGIQVPVRSAGGEIVKQWRRRTDPPLPYEQAGGSKAAPAAKPKVVDAELVTGDDGNTGERITKEQVKRLVGIWRGAGRRDEDVQFWMKKKFGYKATADIKRFDYAVIERELVARGDLLLPGDE